MTATHLEILVEEPSMEEALRQIVPRICPDLSFEVYPYQCKDELLKRLPSRLKGYARWLPDNYRILVVCDRDDENCLGLKRKLEQAARSAGLRTRSQRSSGPYHVVNRLAIEELEAWFFGDWDAVRSAYPGVDPHIPNRRNYRDPDAIKGGTWEALERIFRKAGYFPNGLPKLEVARTIAAHMDPSRNRSRSFRLFRDTLKELASQTA